MKNSFLKSLKYAFLTIPMLTLVVSCHDKKEEIVSPDPPFAESAMRTVLVYMVADNNMGGVYDQRDLTEMQQAATAGDLNDGRLLVFLKTKTSCMLKEITTEGIDTLEIFPSSTIAVSAEVMSDIIEKVKGYAPAKEYGMILWSHGSGWLQDGMNETVSPAKSFGYEQTGSRRMNITTLANVLADKEMSFLYFDCCYMGSVEVAYQLRNVTPVIIASPTEDPINGMPYDLNIKNFFVPTIDFDKVAATTFDYYNEGFIKGDCPCTMTVVRTKWLDDLAAATRQIYERSETTCPPDYNPQLYSDNCAYYYDFGDYVKTLCQDDALLMVWEDAMNKAISYYNFTPWIWSSIEIKSCSGLSTYILRSSDNINTKSYNQLEWYEDVASVFF